MKVNWKNIGFEVLLAILYLSPILIQFLPFKDNFENGYLSGTGISFFITSMFLHKGIKEENEEILALKIKRLNKARLSVGIILVVVTILNFNNEFYSEKLPLISLVTIYTIFANYQSLNYNKNGEQLNVYMEDEEVQSKTNRLQTKVTFFGGIIFIVIILFTPINKFSLTYYMGFFIISSIVITYFYSKYLYRKKYNY
jgi:hypothetical protein